MASNPIDVGDCTLRPATAADIASMVLIDHSNPGPWSTARFEVILGADANSGERVLVALLDGRVEGFLVSSRVLDEVSVHNIAVRSSQQGRGIGSLLVEDLLKQMKVAGVSRCLLEVRESNLAARHLYEKMGFSLDGERKHYYRGPDGREDALLMSRNL